MKKRLLTIAFTVLLVVFGSKAFITLFAYQMIEKVKMYSQDDASITYSWISSSFDGYIAFHDVSVTPYQFKRPFYLKTLELHYSNYLDMLLKLPGLKGGDIRGVVAVTIPSIKSPLKGRDFEQWFALSRNDNWLKFFGLFGCGNVKRISFDSLREMGINEFKAALNLQLEANIDTKEQTANLNINLFQLGKIKINTVWDKSSISGKLGDFNLKSEKLSSLSIEHQESGYFRRLSNYCSGFSGLSRDNYSALAAKEWRLSMQNTGVLTDDIIEKLYRDYLWQGGQLNVSFNLVKRFKLNDFKSIMSENLSQRFGLSVNLNGTPVTGMQLYLDREYFYPPKPLVDKKGINPLSEKEGGAQRQKPFYQSVDFQELSSYLGMEIQVKKKDENVFKGILLSVNDLGLQLSPLVTGGNVVYTLKPNEIMNIDVHMTNE